MSSPAPTGPVAPPGAPAVPAAMDMYVYYKLSGADAARALSLVRAMQAHLTAQWGVATQIKRRLGDGSGVQTWMEVYNAVLPGFQDNLRDAAHDCGLAALAAGGRHVEVFMDFPSCV
jgi:hypothetical protein